jgi:hypothetical protein
MRRAAYSSRRIAFLFPPESGFTLRFALSFAFLAHSGLRAAIDESDPLAQSKSPPAFADGDPPRPAFIVLWR